MNSKRLLVCLFILFSISSISVQAQNTSEVRAISVTGQCVRRIHADRGAITLVAQFENKDAKIASKKAFEIYEKLRAAVRALALKDLELQTTENTIQTMTEIETKTMPRKVNYRASVGLEVITSEISRLGEVSALTQQMPIHRVEDLRTFVSFERDKNLREECLEEAVKNAREKATKMAASAGAKLGKVMDIQETPGYWSYSGVDSSAERVASLSSAGEPESAQPSVEHKSQLITVTINARFALN